MRQEWEPEDLIEVWTLLEDDMKKLRNKSGANRLGFALLLSWDGPSARPSSATTCRTRRRAGRSTRAFRWWRTGTRPTTTCTTARTAR